MGMDIELNVVGRKDSERNAKTDTTYRAIEFLRVDEEGKMQTFTFPHFRNSYFFSEMQSKFDLPWPVLRPNVENLKAIKWYDESLNEVNTNIEPDKRKHWLWGHGYCKLKDLIQWKEEVLKNQHDSESATNSVDEVYDDYYISECEELVAMIDFLYDKAVQILRTDELFENDRELVYDIDNSYLIFAFNN